MKRILTSIFAATMAISTTAVGMGSAISAPLNLPRVEAPASDNVVNVQQRRGFYQRGGRHYYNGHRGYRHARPGWRQQNGWWFPPAAFALGAIVGGAIANQPSAGRPVGSAHVRWCYDRYRSYRASDNTFQPYNGPRQQCYSPYS